MGCLTTKSLRSVLPNVKECRSVNNGYCHLEEEKRIMKKARAFYIGEGVHRRGYRFIGQKGTRCVIKLPIEEYTRGANITEIKTWKELPKKKYFVEVSDFAKNGDWITQPKVITLRELGIDSEDDIVDEFQGKIEGDGIHCSDLHSKNLGVYDKNKRKRITTSMIKILDYGFGVCYMGKKLSSKIDIDTKREERDGRKSSSSSTSEILPKLFSIFD